jgi:tetratricopeptide (TPR) repeat protein
MTSARSWRIVVVTLCAITLIGAGTWLVWHRRPAKSAAAQAQSGYVDPSVCAGCHGDIAATYRKTGMGRSFSLPALQNVTEGDSRNNRLDHKLSGFSYTMIERDGKLLLRRHTIGFDGKETNIVEEQVDYIIGSGNHARTYLHRTEQGQLVELPVSWYSEGSGSWAMSPGYDRRDQEDIHRTITPECLFCHDGYPQGDEPTAHDEKELAVFAAKLPEGIDCQRCHGPGRAHVEAAKATNPSPQQIRNSIVNPGRLPRDRQMEVCMQCHLETTSRHIPAEIRAFGRAVSSYRPSQPLGDYKIYFDREASSTDDNFEVAHAAYRLRKSACFAKSDMTCLTCHDPHDIPRGEEAIQHYVEVCAECHKAIAHRVSLPAGSNCISCHMPKRRTDDVVHVVMTDHFIRTNQPQHNLLAPISEKIEPERGGKVFAYYPPDYDKNSNAALYLAVAQVESDAGSESLSRLENVLASLSPPEADPYLALGRAYVRRGDNLKAIRWFDEALKREPDDYPADLALVPALMATGQDARALDVLRRAVTFYPNDDQLFTNLGNVYLRMNMLADAQNALSHAVAANPERSDAHNLLGLVALRNDEKTTAEKSFREAIRWQPDLVEAENNLATLLTGNHDFPEAEFYFQKAIENNPDFAEAHHGLGLLLILTRSVPRATAELQEAVRLEPDSPQARSDLADLFAAQGHAAQAAEQYQQVLRIMPDQADAELGLGLCLLREQNVGQARQHLERAAASSDANIRQAANQALSQIAP